MGYDPNTFVVVWILYRIAKDNELKLVGRGGFQAEDSIQPVMTEPFLALLGSESNPFEGQQFQSKHIATDIFPIMLAVFRKWSDNASMRGLALPTNPASGAVLTLNQFVLMHAEGEKVTTQAWERDYEVYVLR